MNEARAYPRSREVEKAVLVRACESGRSPRVLVSHVVWTDDVVHEEQLVFSSLRLALDYAREALDSSDGPLRGAAEIVPAQKAS
jgi:hypothetical protein